VPFFYIALLIRLFLSRSNAPFQNLAGRWSFPPVNFDLRFSLINQKPSAMSGFLSSADKVKPFLVVSPPVISLIQSPPFPLSQWRFASFSRFCMTPLWLLFKAQLVLLQFSSPLPFPILFASSRDLPGIRRPFPPLFCFFVSSVQDYDNGGSPFFDFSGGTFFPFLWSIAPLAFSSFEHFPFPRTPPPN